jgi:hypothetical protein
MQSESKSKFDPINAMNGAWGERRYSFSLNLGTRRG